MIRSAVAILFFFALQCQAYGQAVEQLFTTVKIAAWTTTGERIEKIWVALSALDGGEKYRGVGRDVELSIPTGEYLLQVEAPGFQSRRQLFRAYQPKVFRSIALPVALLHGQSTPRLTGVVRNYEGDKSNLRVRLVGLYGDEIREAVPDSQGSFGFPADEGFYLLLVVADGEKGVKIIESEPMNLVGTRTVMIDLKGKY